MKGLEFIVKAAPENGRRIHVMPGIDWVRLPLPFALNHVNCWLINEPNKPADSPAADQCLIDTGLATPDIKAIWQTLYQHSGVPNQVLVTHFHPDHMGLAGWFAEQGSEVLGSEIEMDIARSLQSSSTEEYALFYVNWYRRNGIAEGPIAQVAQAGNNYARGCVAPPAQASYLHAGDTLTLGGREFEVKIGRGHAPDMLMLYSDAEPLLIAADQILPGITPNISLHPNMSDQNPLASFIEDLKTLRGLPEETLVLPSHGLPFRGLRPRIDALLLHHDMRCAEIVKECQRPSHAAGLFPLLFKRELDAQQLSFALGEALSHVHYLQHQGLLQSFQDSGVTYYQAT